MMHNTYLVNPVSTQFFPTIRITTLKRVYCCISSQKYVLNASYWYTKVKSWVNQQIEQIL